MQPPTIRLATLEDAGNIVDVCLASWEAAYRGLMPDELLDGFTRERRIALWRERWTNPDPARRAWVACEGERVVAYASTGATEEQDEGTELVSEIHSLYVHPAAWRGGLGGLLTAHGLRDAFARGSTEARLWCLTANHVGRGFYERFGFEVAGPEVEKTLFGFGLTHTRYALTRERFEERDAER